MTDTIVQCMRDVNRLVEETITQFATELRLALTVFGAVYCMIFILASVLVVAMVGTTRHHDDCVIACRPFACVRHVHVRGVNINYCNRAVQEAGAKGGTDGT